MAERRLAIPRETLHCTQCGKVMDYRLGQYECPDCGHVLAAAQPEQQRAARPPAGGSGGSSWDPGAQYRNAPSSGELPPPPALSGGGYGMGGTYGGPSAASSAGDDPLRTEKLIYIGLQALGLLILIGITIAASQSISGIPGDAENMSGAQVSAMLVGGSILLSVVSIGILWLTLFGREVWLKWTCAGCTGCASLLAAAGAMAGSATNTMYGEPGSAGSGLLQLAINIWFLSILWRDIQNVNSGY